MTTIFSTVFANVFFVALIAYTVSDQFTIGKTRAKIARDPAARIVAYRQWTRILWLLAVCALVPFGFGTFFLHLAATPDWLPSSDFVTSAGSGALVGIVGATVGLFFVARKKPETFAKLLAPIDFLIPRTIAERRWYALLSITAGITEEIIYRGFALHYLLALPFHWQFSTCALVAAGAFGIAHVYQGALPALATALIALVFTAVFLYTGNLLLPIVLHALFDLRILAMVPSPRRAVLTR